MSDDVRLDLLKEAIAKSGMDGQTKSALADDLRLVQEINDTDDQVLRWIKLLFISGVRKELLAHERVSKALEMHTEACARRRAEEIKAVVESWKIDNAIKEAGKGGDSIGVRGMQVCGKAALIVAAGVALALIVFAATGRLPW